MSHLVILISGLITALIGGELLVRNSIKLADRLRVSTTVMGTTFSAFVTSAPELSVAINSALKNTTAISVGDCLGSNVINIALILGLALAAKPLSIPRQAMRREFLALVLLSILLCIFSWDGMLSRPEGITLLVLFACWLIAIMKNIKAPEPVGIDYKPNTASLTLPLLYSLLGLACLVTGGNLMVTGATGIAHKLAINDFIIGSAIIAFGTSVPELFTILVAIMRGFNGMALGTMLGSNIFNSTFIMGLALTIQPTAINTQAVFITSTFTLLSLLLAYPNKDNVLGKERGYMLILLYAAYLTWLALSANVRLT